MEPMGRLPFYCPPKWHDVSLAQAGRLGVKLEGSSECNCRYTNFRARTDEGFLVSTRRVPGHGPARGTSLTSRGKNSVVSGKKVTRVARAHRSHIKRC